jgi:DNA-directed RNA polymerase specialized sigma24 family protein
MTTRTKTMTASALLTVAANNIMPEPSKAAELLVFRTFVLAHLLTASLEQAESASLEAVDAWNPETESDEALLQHGIAAALRRTVPRGPSGKINSVAGDSYLPAELQAILKLRPSLRRCFALRMLGGFSPADCACLLHLHPLTCEKYTSSAVVRLAKLNRYGRKNI